MKVKYLYLKKLVNYLDSHYFPLDYDIELTYFPSNLCRCEFLGISDFLEHDFAVPVE